MKKNSRSESAIFNARLIAAFTFFLAAVFLATFSFAGPKANRETTPMQARNAQMAPAVFGDPDPTVPGAPRYQNFYAPDGTSAQPGSGEFNIGFDPITP